MNLGICIDYSRVIIRADKALGFCPKRLDTRCTMGIFDLVPEKFCPLAFHTIYPYVMAFKQGARLGWLKDRLSVEASCPNPQCAVVMRLIKRASKHNICDIEIIGLKSACPYGMNSGNIFLDVRQPQHACWRAFDAIMPYINELANPAETNQGPSTSVLSATCPGCNYSNKNHDFSTVAFKITRRMNDVGQ